MAAASSNAASWHRRGIGMCNDVRGGGGMRGMANGGGVSAA